MNDDRVLALSANGEILKKFSTFIDAFNWSKSNDYDKIVFRTDGIDIPYMNKR